MCRLNSRVCSKISIGEGLGRGDIPYTVQNLTVNLKMHRRRWQHRGYQNALVCHGLPLCAIFCCLYLSHHPDIRLTWNNNVLHTSSRVLACCKAILSFPLSGTDSGQWPPARRDGGFELLEPLLVWTAAMSKRLEKAEHLFVSSFQFIWVDRYWLVFDNFLG